MCLDFMRESNGQQSSIKMQRSERNDNWMHTKYGVLVVPWECTIQMDNLINSATGEFEKDDHANFHYRYRKIKAS